jgi:hypothetical protein
MRDITNYLLSRLRLNSDAGRTRDDNATDGTGAVIGVDIGHHQIHEGNHFYHKGFKSLGNGASYSFLLKAPLLKLVHFNFYITSPKEMSLSFLENVSVTADGTALSVFNNKRGSQGSPANLMTMFHTPTTTGGSEIFPASVGIGIPLGGGGNIRNECEIILKQEFNYKITLTNVGATTAVIDYLFCWYEVS